MWYVLKATSFCIASHQGDGNSHGGKVLTRWLRNTALISEAVHYAAFPLYKVYVLT